jgi:hypothetical protein
MARDFDRLIAGNHAFPDPFDPRSERVLREYVWRAAAPVWGKSWFVGFFADKGNQPSRSPPPRLHAELQ